MNSADPRASVLRLQADIAALIQRMEPTTELPADLLEQVVQELVQALETHDPDLLSLEQVGRIRVWKFVARFLPPALFRDRSAQQEIQREIAGIIVRFLRAREDRSW